MRCVIKIAFIYVTVNRPHILECQISLRITVEALILSNSHGTNPNALNVLHLDSVVLEVSLGDLKTTVVRSHGFDQPVKVVIIYKNAIINKGNV